jgi:hypothetical protein
MRIPKRLISGSQLTGSAATYYTVPTNTNAVISPKAVITRLILCNTTAGAVACTVYLVPSGGAAGVTNTITSAKSIAVGETWCCPEAEGQVLEAGGFIQAKGLDVTIMCSGHELTT